MAEELRLRANGIWFRCLSAGDQERPLALLLHGFPEGAESWTEQLRGMAAAGLWALAPDLRGYGGSDCPGGEDAYRMPELLADVGGLLDALGRERCHLAGHDWGALVGWSFASYHGERLLSWSALSVGHPTAFREAMAVDDDQMRRSSYIRLFRTAEKAEDVLSEDGWRRLRAIYRSPPTPDAVPEHVVEAYVRGFARPGRLTAALNYYRANMSRDAHVRFPPAPHPITTPTQLIWGEEDPAIGRGPTERTAGMVAGAYRLEALSGAGHWLQFEHPGEITRLLVDWIARSGEPPAGR
jgi:pimeloyl-ACP methyl ester carboxylesterase